MREHARLLLSVLLVGCASNVDEEVAISPFGFISFDPMFSAFDGTHDYAVTPSIPSADASTDKDPLLASSIKWELDGAFVKREEFPDLPAAIKLTTKKAGQTTVGVTMKTLSGTALRSKAWLTISQAKASEWDAGDARYNNEEMKLEKLPMTTCGLVLPMDPPRSCSSCHTPLSGIAFEHTPTQTAGYSDDQLVKIFTGGAKPAGGTFNSPFLRAAPMPDCIYNEFHTWEMSDEEKKGVVWKLRSLSPRVLEEP
jgi:hypothetical protein